MTITVALLMFLLLGFMGMALDYGHLFVIRSELQTAMDACALAGAQELNGQPDALTRASNAGIAAGNANNVDRQSTTWNGKPKVSAADLSFFDNAHVTTADATKAHYVRCTHTQAGTATPLLHMFSFISSVGAATMDVGAFAEATTTPAQSVCPVPLGLKPKSGGVKPDYGFSTGEWVTLLSKSTSTNGQIGWANLDGSNNASETNAEMQGHCGTRLGDTLGTPGVQQSISDIWNTRFGIYKNNGDASVDHPDYTGYVYTTPVAGSGKGNGGGTPGTWASGANAYPDFVSRRQTFDPCGTSVNDCQNTTGLKLNAKVLATSGPGGEMQTYGTNRRLVAVPVVDPVTSKVIDFACMLMLQPLSTPMIDVQLEYRGNAANPASPCTSSGLPGGAAGPLVPVLVR